MFIGPFRRLPNECVNVRVCKTSIRMYITFNYFTELSWQILSKTVRSTEDINNNEKIVIKRINEETENETMSFSLLKFGSTRFFLQLTAHRIYWRIESKTKQNGKSKEWATRLI